MLLVKENPASKKEINLSMSLTVNKPVAVFTCLVYRARNLKEKKTGCERFIIGVR